MEDEHTVEHGGLLWKPKPDATATAEEFIRARTLIVELHQDSRWNPWVLDDRAEEYAAAEAVFDQWRRAEPWFRPWTREELDARDERLDAEFAARRAEQEVQRQARAAQYDRLREEARLALLECEAGIQHAQDEHDGLIAKTRFPAMPDSRRSEKVAELAATLTAAHKRLATLREQVGDRETVVDEHGCLPADRRERSLTWFRMDREREVHRLRASVAELTDTMQQHPARSAERNQFRHERERASSRLQKLIDTPPQTVDDMCSECPIPFRWHGYVISGDSPPWAGPCSAWPNWAARLHRVRQQLLDIQQSKEEAPQPAAPKPEPLAVIPSGLPISEITSRLAEIQAKHPDAQVRRGSRNRWEVWPSKDQEQA